jgi:transcription elongation factor Elf1
MKAEGPGISLGKHGMKTDTSLECSEGGRHAVSEVALASAKARGSGAVTCIKCGASVSVSRA